MVDLPAPVGPTNDIVSPARMCRSTSRSTGTAGSYPNDTPIELDVALDRRQRRGVGGLLDRSGASTAAR